VGDDGHALTLPTPRRSRPKAWDLARSAISAKVMLPHDCRRLVGLVDQPHPVRIGHLGPVQKVAHIEWNEH